MNILGINFGHGPAAALVIDGKVIAAIEEEKLIRKKGHIGFPLLATNYVLKMGTIGLKDIHYVAIGCENLAEWSYSFAHLNRIFTDINLPEKIVSKLLFIAKDRFPSLNYSPILVKYFYYQLAKLGIEKQKVILVEHHLAHAASAHYTSPWQESFIVTSDGKGDGVSSSIAIGNNYDIDVLDKQPDLVSIGQLYQSVTKALGYRENRHEGKITGLAAHGDPERSFKLFNSILKFDIQGKFTNSFQEQLQAHGSSLYYFKEHVNPKTWISPSYVKSLNGPLRNIAIGYQYYINFIKDKMSSLEPKDIAAGVQKLAEELIVDYVTHHFKKHSKSPNVCLAGGLFANVKINQRIKEIPGVENVYVQPAMDDAGTALGAALNIWIKKSGQALPKTNEYWPQMQTVYMGPSYSEAEMENALKTGQISYRCSENVEAEIAKLINDGKIVGRYNGALEWGPRALGNRSILASAGKHEINDTLNKRLNRTEFMPFAPSVLDEDGERFFEGYNAKDEAAKYMTITYNVKEEGQKLFPAAVHVDNTARPQIVFKEHNESYYRILSEYKALTGFGVIVNTSFNMHEEPILDTPHDAVHALQKNAVDVLAMGPFLATL